MAILEVADEMEAVCVMDNDHSVLGGLNCFELSPMQVPVSRAKGL